MPWLWSFTRSTSLGKVLLVRMYWNSWMRKKAWRKKGTTAKREARGVSIPLILEPYCATLPWVVSSYALTKLTGLFHSFSKKVNSSCFSISHCWQNFLKISRTSGLNNAFERIGFLRLSKILCVIDSILSSPSIPRIFVMIRLTGLASSPVFFKNMDNALSLRVKTKASTSTSFGTNLFLSWYRWSKSFFIAFTSK